MPIDDKEASRRHAEFMKELGERHAISMLDRRAANADRVRDETWARQDRKDRNKRFDKERADAKKTKAAKQSNLNKQQFTKEQAEARQEFTDEMYDKRRTDQLKDQKRQAKLVLKAEAEKTRRSLSEISSQSTAYRDKLDADFNLDTRTRKLEETAYKFRSDVDVDAYRENRRTDASYMRKEVNTRLHATLIEKIADHVLAKDMICFQRGIDNRIESQSIDEIADKLDALDAAHDRHDRQSLNVEDKLQLRNITEQED